MKKFFLILGFFLFVEGFCYSQFVYKWESKSFSFTSPFELTKMETTSADEFNWQNDEYTIEISAFGIGYYDTYYQGGAIKKVAKEVAIDQSFYDIEDGDTLPLIDKGYYVLAKTPGMDANQYACVIVVVGLSVRKKVYFEARIYCYNNKYKKGIEIAKSFAFAK